MKNKFIIASMLSLCACSINAQEKEVVKMKYAGPFSVKGPVMIDSTDVNSKRFSSNELLNAPLNLDNIEKGTNVNGPLIVKNDNDALHMVGFTLSNKMFTTGAIEVKGISNYNIYVDGKLTNGGALTLQPSVHNIVVKYLTEAKNETTDTLSITVDAKNAELGEIGEKRTFTLNDVLTLKQYTAANISPDGKFLIASTYCQDSQGREIRKNNLWNLSQKTYSSVQGFRWMPRTNKFIYTRKNDGYGYTLIAVDPSTLQESIITENLPESSFTMSPTEDYVIYSVVKEGPKESKDVYEVVTPDDRQPGWRDRTNLFRYDFKSGLVQQITYGYHNVWLYDISADGKKYLIGKSEYKADDMRPTDFMTMYVIDSETMQMDTIVKRDGFISGAYFSPDAKSILVRGSAEAFNGIGLNINPGQSSSNFDYQLFMVKENDVVPLTKDFNPSVGSVVWSKADGMVYFSAEDKDCENLFRMDPKTNRITKINSPEEVVGRWTVSANSGTIAYYGESATNGQKLYTLNNKTFKSNFLEDINKRLLDKIDLGECHPYTWVNPEGDSICCRYYLPPHFDPEKKYPVIVNYYGGCSPTSRTFGGRYSAQAYSALGYVVLVVNPRGATGFGQKWSAMHVNTAGKGIAEDIIGAVTSFRDGYSFVDGKKIGCIGASYGGFMTQYLQTQTDIFAAAVSHAGISDHTSYWGEGYWGYSYSQTSMANSYPWTRKDLYVDQSPLYNAEKINTPLLFIHGTSDTNVPVGESIQMYTALKLLGRPTAMVLVEGENHWIMETQKRIKWQNTIWAWFAKYLQDNDCWWEQMYSHKDL